MPTSRSVSAITFALLLGPWLGLGCVNLTPPWDDVTVRANGGAGGSLAHDGGRGGDGGAAGAYPGTDAASDIAATNDATVNVVIDSSPSGVGADRPPPIDTGSAVSSGGSTGGGAGGSTDGGGSGGSTSGTSGGYQDAAAQTRDALADGKTDAAAPDLPREAGRSPGLDATPPGPETSSDGPCALCSLGQALVHRYDFAGTGTKVTDSVGTAHGTVVNAQLSGSGTLVLAGGTSGQYVTLPAHILSTLTDATLEVWVTWTGGGDNQRILDFGSNGQVGSKLQATTTVIISPNSAPAGISPRLRASYSNQVSLTGTFVDAASPLTTGKMSHIAAVFDGQQHVLSLYLNGALVGQTTGLGALSLIDDVNNWLGHSQYSDDPGFAGTYHEFRIYAAALTADQIRASDAAGPGAVLGP